MFSKRTTFTCLILALAGLAQGAGPDAPKVTVRADGTKQLRFDWNYVPRANYYELWFRANDGATPVKFADLPSWRPRVTNGVAIHLLNWKQARYWVKACNPGGCTASAPIAVSAALADAIGFEKSSFPLAEAFFGAEVAVSADGSTLVAAAPEEANDRNIQYPIAALYVFARVGASWHFEARLAPVPAQIEDGPGLRIAIDADGSRFIVGMPSYVSNSVPQDDGQALIYERTTTGWRIAQRIAPSGALATGEIADLDAAGNTVLLGTSYPYGALQIWRRNASGWTLSGTIPYPGGSATCRRAALSADGLVIARACLMSGGGEIQVFGGASWGLRNRIPFTAPGPDYDFSGFAVDRDANTIAAAFARASDDPGSHALAAVFHRTTGDYRREATFTPAGWFSDTRNFQAQFGTALALSPDGRFLAAGHPGDDGAGVGVLAPPLAAGGPPNGAVYLFERHDGSWKLRNVVKPDQHPVNIGTFGAAVSFGDAGRTLVIGDPGEDTYVANPGSEQGGDGGGRTGAVWIY